MPTHATLPASSSGLYLKDDGTWDAPSGGPGGVSDGDKGDIVVSSSGTVWSIDTGVMTTAGRALVDDADAAAQRTTLGLGTAATTAATDYAVTAKGVTNGDSHDHSGGDGAQIAYSGLSGLPTLGGAAALSVGTTAGTVAAGDHTHAAYQAADTQLTDLAALSYTGNTLKVIRVNAGETAFELAAPAAGGEAFPIGSVFISVVATNPGTLLGYGTWSAFGAGRVMVGLDSGDTDFDTVEETGGAKTVASAGSNAAEAAHTHSVTSNVAVADHASHTHTYTEVPNHVHLVERFPTATGGSTGFTVDTSMSGTPSNTAQNTATPTGGVATGTTNGPSATLTHSVTNNAVTSAAGSSHNHAFTGSATSVVQPYITCYFWKRTA